MTPPRETVATATADDVPLCADDLARMKVAHIAAHAHDFTDELMTHDHRHGDRLLRPRVPFVDVEVSAADAGLVDLDQHIVDADFGLGHVLEPEAAFGFCFDEGFHGFGQHGVYSIILYIYPSSCKPYFGATSPSIAGSASLQRNAASRSTRQVPMPDSSAVFALHSAPRSSNA